MAFALNPNEEFVMNHILKLMAVFVRTGDHAMALIAELFKHLSVDHLHQLMDMAQSAIEAAVPASTPIVGARGDAIEQVVENLNGTDETEGSQQPGGEPGETPPAAGEPAADPPAAAKKTWKPPVKKQ